MAIEVFNRYENKYLLNEETYQLFCGELLTYMEYDEHNKEHGFYTISNVYFDTQDDQVIKQNISKPKYKEKLRLRSYGVPNEQAKVYLEIKKKVFGLVNKRRTSLTLPEAYTFVSTGISPSYQPYMNQQVIREIEYFLKRYTLIPKVYIAYDRKALFSKESRDLRITFDTNIRCRRDNVRLEDGDYGEKLLEPNQWLMEIKAEKTFPVWLASLLSKYKLYPTSFSKYANEYKKMRRQRG